VEFVFKLLCYLQIENAKHYFDRDFPQSGAMLINYFAQGLHRKLVEKKKLGREIH
jgi:hypothetical protein